MPFTSADRLDGHVSARLETEQIESAKRRGVLVLFADGLLEDIDFDVGSLFRELTCGYALAAISMQRIEQANGKAARTAQSR